MEALVSFTLLAVVAAASVTATVSATKTSKTNTDRVTAANLAQRDLQSARTLRFPNYPTSTVLPSSEVAGGTTYKIVRSVTAKRPDGSTIGTCPATPNFDSRPYMVVTTTVTWAPDAPANRVVMATEIAC